MNVDSILVSDYAVVDAGGKLNIIGAFSHLGAPGFPCQMTQIAVTLVIHGHSAEAGTHHTIEINLFNQRREKLNPIPLTAEFTFLPPEQVIAGMPIRHMHTVQIFALTFPEPGAYGFEVLIDGTYHAGASIYIAQQG